MGPRGALFGVIPVRGKGRFAEQGARVNLAGPVLVEDRDDRAPRRGLEQAGREIANCLTGAVPLTDGRAIFSIEGFASARINRKDGTLVEPHPCATAVPLADSVRCRIAFSRQVA